MADHTISIKEKEKIIREYLEKEGISEETILEELSTLEEGGYDDNSIAEFTERISTNPEFANIRGIKEAVEAIRKGADAYNVFKNISESKEQIRRSEETIAGLKQPALPTVAPKSVELEEATETARREYSRPAREIDPILQRNMDLLNVNLRKAETASAGQAGIYGSYAQNAINQARRANIQAIPALEQIRQNKFKNYTNLIGMQQQESKDRFYQGFNIFDQANKRYTSQLAGASQVGAYGRQNLALSRQGLGSALGNIAESFMPFVSKFSAMTEADKDAGAYGDRVDDNLTQRFSSNPYRTDSYRNLIGGGTDYTLMR